MKIITTTEEIGQLDKFLGLTKDLFGEVKTVKLSTGIVTEIKNGHVNVL